MQDYLLIMKQELVLAIILFLLLTLKLGRHRGNGQLLNLVNLLLLLNCVVDVKAVTRN